MITGYVSELPSMYEFASSLRKCTSVNQLKSIHSHIQEFHLQCDTFHANLLIQMYGKLGDLHSAKHVFDQIPHKNVYSWTLILAAYAKNGQMQEARAAFDKMPERGVVSWNTMITGYVRGAHYQLALHLVCLMDFEGCELSDVTVLLALEACGNIHATSAGRSIHRSLACEHALLRNVSVGAALVRMYGKFQSIRDASAVFENLSLKNVVSWTAMLAAYAENGHFYHGIVLFRRMILEGVRPDAVSIICVLDACAGHAVLSLAENIFSSIVVSEGFTRDVRIGNAAVNMFGKCACIKRSKMVFDTMPDRNVVSWTSMISAYAQNGQFTQALELFRNMDLNGVLADSVAFISAIDSAANLRELNVGSLLHEECRLLSLMPDLGIATSVINLYGKCRRVELAKETFDEIQRKKKLQLSHTGVWNALVSAYSQNRQGKNALHVFATMDLEGISPNRITVITVLDACANVPALDHEKVVSSVLLVIEEELGEHGDDIRVRNALVNMYGKSGDLNKSREIFNKLIPQADIVSWSTMVEAYAQNGQPAEAVSVFQAMELEGVVPNAITFASILSACTHAGLVALGMFFFSSQVNDYGLVTECDQPYVGIVDLLARAGSIPQAELVVDDMPFHPHSTVLTALLSACRIHGDKVAANRIAEKLAAAAPNSRALYQLLFNTYAENKNVSNGESSLVRYLI